jgi:hypothetical protein
VYEWTAALVATTLGFGCFAVTVSRSCRMEASSGRARAAPELVAALDVAGARLRAGHQGAEIPRIRSRFDEVQERLRAVAR